MWATHTNEKNKITFEPSQPPYKLTQNKSVSWHKKPPMNQNFKKTFTTLLNRNNNNNNNY